MIGLSLNVTQNEFPLVSHKMKLLSLSVTQSKSCIYTLKKRFEVALGCVANSVQNEGVIRRL